MSLRDSLDVIVYKCSYSVQAPELPRYKRHLKNCELIKKREIAFFWRRHLPNPSLSGFRLSAPLRWNNRAEPLPLSHIWFHIVSHMSHMSHMSHCQSCVTYCHRYVSYLVSHCQSYVLGHVGMCPIGQSYISDVPI